MARPGMADMRGVAMGGAQVWSLRLPFAVARLVGAVVRQPLSWIDVGRIQCVPGLVCPDIAGRLPAFSIFRQVSNLGQVSLLMQVGAK